MVDCHSKNSTGVDFINCFAPCADLLRPTPNICASKKLLKNWVQGAKVGRKGAKLFMKSTPGVCGGVGWVNGHYVPAFRAVKKHKYLSFIFMASVSRPKLRFPSRTNCV